MNRQDVTVAVERFVTIKEASRALGIPYYKLNRAANTGAFPVYTIGNGKRLVRLSEVIAAIERSQAPAIERMGGSDE